MSPDQEQSTALAPVINEQTYMELFGSGLVEMSRTGLLIAAESEQEFPIEKFGMLMKFLNEITEATPWAVGDAINAGETLYGQRASQYADAATLTGYSEKYIGQIAFTCANIRPEDRDGEVPFALHRVVTKFKPAEQRRLLKKAHTKEGIMTLREFQDLVREEEKKTAARTDGAEDDAGSDREPEVAPAERGGKRFNFSFRARESREPMADYSAEAQEAFDRSWKIHTDPKFAERAAQEEERDVQSQERIRKLKKIEGAAAELPEAQRAAYVARFDKGEDSNAVVKAIKARVKLNKHLEDLPAEEHQRFANMLDRGNEFKDVVDKIKERKTKLEGKRQVDDLEAGAAQGRKRGDTSGLAIPKPKDTKKGRSKKVDSETSQ